MTYHKTEVFEDEFQELAKLAKVMSHPARIAILAYLGKTKVCVSGDITTEIPLSRTTVSQHLQELKNAGLIIGEVEGKNVSYCLCATCISKIVRKFNKFFNVLDFNNSGSGSNCCQ